MFIKAEVYAKLSLIHSFIYLFLTIKSLKIYLYVMTRVRKQGQYVLEPSQEKNNVKPHCYVAFGQEKQERNLSAAVKRSAESYSCINL